MGGANPPGNPATTEPRGMMNDMEWLTAVRSINGNSAHTLRLAQDAVAAGSSSAWPWIVAAAGAVGTHMLGAFGTMFWMVFCLWAADMILGNLRVLVDPARPWNPSKNLDGVIRIIVYGILGVVLVLIEGFAMEASGVNIDGLLLGGGYAVCALNEARSLVRHFTYFIPGFSGFSGKILKALKAITNNKGGGA